MLPTPIQSLANGQPDDSANQNKQKGTGFTNIGNILNANQGAGQKIGQSLGSSLTGQANSVKAGIDASQNQFNTQAGQAKDNANSAIQAGQQYVRAPGTDDATYLNNLNNADTDYSKIGQTINNATYNGPTNLANADQLNTQAANVSALGRLAGTSEGQSQLLRSQVAQKGNYSQGQNALDSLLLGAQGQQYVQQGRSDASQVGQAANTAAANAQAQATAAQSAIANNKAQLLQNLNSSLTGSGTVDSTANPQGITGLETTATNQATQYTNDAQRLQQLLSGHDAQGNIIKATDVTDADKALLANSGQYGVQNSNVYIDPNDPNSGYNAINQLASRLTTQGLGNQYYQGNQQTAAQNLAKILGDTQSQQDIGNNKFNTQILANNGDEDSILGNAASGINNQINQNQGTVSALQQLAGNYPQVNVQQLYDTINHGDQGAVNQAYGLLNDLRSGYQNATGQDFQQTYDAQGQKDIAGFLNQQSDPYQQKATTLQNQLNTNSTDLQSAVLKMLAGQQ